MKPLIEIRKSEPDGNFGMALFIAVALCIAAYQGNVSWWAAIGGGVLVFLAFAAVLLARSWYSGRYGVKIYADGIIFRSDESPFSNAKSWWCYPWESIVHIDLRRSRFTVRHLGLPDFWHAGVQEMIPIDRREAMSIAEDLESFQHRCDIPKTFPVLTR